MTTGEYSPLLRDGSNRSSATQHHLPIYANYYDITDIESWPVAGLLVLLDGQAQPVRAELHLYDDLDEHTQEAAIRQARLVLQERYLGGTPVPVRILETLQVREEMLVRLPPVGTRPLTVRGLNVRSFDLRWRPHGMIGGAILVLVLLFWIGFALAGAGRDGGESGTPVGTSESVSEMSGSEVTPAPSLVQGENPVDGETAVAAPVMDEKLPVSRNARGDLGIGMQVQVVTGLRLALRSEPGIERGIVIGEMSDGNVATIIGGPEYTQGDTDTIVWWYVELPNSTQAWAAANTSKETLLMPVQ